MIKVVGHPWSFMRSIAYLNEQNSETVTLRGWEAGSLTLMKESSVDVLDRP